MAGLPADRLAGVTHVVWDWNGTLFDDVGALIEATIEAFEATGLPPVTVERYRRLHTQPIDEFYDRLAGAPLSPSSRRALHAAFHAAYARRRPFLSLSAETAPVLSALAELGVSQSVLSMHPHERLISLIERFGIADRFTRIDGQRGPDSGYKSGHLAVHLEKLGVYGENVLVVGDSVDDAVAARKAGTRCVLYASGLHADEVLAGQGVPVVTSLREAVAFAAGDRP